MPHYTLTFLILYIFSGVLSANEEEVDTSLLREILEKRDQYECIHTLIVQKKKLPSIADTLVTEGEVWMVPNKFFRWQLGSPSTDLAILREKKVYVYDLKNLTYDDHKIDSRSVRPIILLLGIGKKGSYNGLLDSFKAVSTESKGGEYTITFHPDSSLMKRALKELTIIFDIEKSFPKKVVWTQKDDTVITTLFNSPSFEKFDPEEVFSLPVGEFVKK